MSMGPKSIKFEISRKLVLQLISNHISTALAANNVLNFFKQLQKLAVQLAASHWSLVMRFHGWNWSINYFRYTKYSSASPLYVKKMLMYMLVQILDGSHDLTLTICYSVDTGASQWMPCWNITEFFLTNVKNFQCISSKIAVQNNMENCKQKVEICKRRSTICIGICIVAYPTEIPNTWLCIFNFFNYKLSTETLRFVIKECQTCNQKFEICCKNSRTCTEDELYYSL